MCIFHKWSKWSKPYFLQNTMVNHVLDNFDVYQLKVCHSCGIIKTSLVENGSSQLIDIYGSIGEDEQCQQLDKE